VPITIAEAALGASVTAPLLGVLTSQPPTTVQLKVPPGTGSGQKLRVRGRGLTNGKGTTGNFFAVIQIYAPMTISEDDRILLLKLAEGLKNPRESAPFADLMGDMDT